MLDRIKNKRLFGLTPGDWSLGLIVILSTSIGLLFDAWDKMFPGCRMSSGLARILFTGAILVATCFYRWQVVSRRTKIQRQKTDVEISQTKLVIEELLEVMIYTDYAHNDIDNYRANVMLVQNEKLVICYAYGMENAPDLNIKLEKFQGCAGQAWGTAKQRVADLQQSDRSPIIGPGWNLTQKQRNVTTHLGAIFSTPIFNPNNDEQVIGILNIDSKLSIQKTSFLVEGFDEKMEKWASTIGRILLDFYPNKEIFT